MIDIDDICTAPWKRGEWHGSLVSVDGTPSHDFAREDVSALIAWEETGDRRDGNTSGIAVLADGRFISWEASYGPTGNGFGKDAYGGESDIFFAATADVAASALSEAARELLGGGWLAERKRGAE